MEIKTYQWEKLSANSVTGTNESVLCQPELNLSYANMCFHGNKNIKLARIGLVSM